ncbi:MAG: DsbA family protein [Patescibacteria group bacterium]
MKAFILSLGLLLVLTACTPKYTDPNTPRATKGSPQAQVLVEEFADFQCPACGSASPVMKQLAEQYGDRVQWKYYHFPLVQIHPFAFNAALASECANDQGKFWEYHDLLYSNQTNLGKGDLKGYAGELGLDTESFNACLDSRAKQGLVRNDMALGEQRGVNGTPSIYLNGQLLQDWTTLEARLASIFAEPGEGGS